MSENKGCPDRIWLQSCDECYAGAYKEGDGVTWCEDHIGHECDADKPDMEYVRADVFLSRLRGLEAQMEIPNERLKEIDRDNVLGCEIEHIAIELLVARQTIAEKDALIGELVEEGR